MYIAENCLQCGDCFVNCQWIDADQTQAIAWVKQLRAGEHAEVLDKCITCYACNETCPNLANPFDLIAVLQEKYHTSVSESTVSQMEQRYLFSGDLKAVPHADRILSLCVFNKTDAHLIQGPLYNLPQVSGKPYFCWVLFSHMAGESIQRKHARENSLCCGGAKLMLSGVNSKPDQEMNFADAKQAGAQAMVCLCPICLHSFSLVAAEQQLPLIFIGDLARMALGEIEVPV